MLFVISPAKALDMTPLPDLPQTQPQMLPDANALANVARGLSAGDLKRLMKLSDKLADLNADRFRAWQDDPSPEAVKQAAFAFAGDTYRGLEAKTLDADALHWAQDHLRILSGLYGLLRPLDAIQPYRLEMGTRLATGRGKTLYAYWGDRITAALNAQAKAVGARALVNCASQEYFGAVAPEALDLPVITPVFLEQKGDAAPKTISFWAKQARGAMARFAAERRLTDPEALLSFDAGGYAHAPDLSAPDRPAFLRRHAD